jgi:hypothetical protein
MKGIFGIIQTVEEIKKKKCPLHVEEGIPTF